MNNQTHYWFAFCVLILVTSLEQTFSQIDQIVLFPVACLISSLALLPNKLDELINIDHHTNTQILRSRHPLSHHPLLLIGIFLCYLSIEAQWQNLHPYLYFGLLGIISYGSHFVLDVFTTGGLPLGLTPSLFAQDPTKHYSYQRDVNLGHFLRLGRSIARDDPRYNQWLTYICQSVVFIHGMSLLTAILTKPDLAQAIVQELTRILQNIGKIIG